MFGSIEETPEESDMASNSELINFAASVIPLMLNIMVSSRIVTEDSMLKVVQDWRENRVTAIKHTMEKAKASLSENSILSLLTPDLDAAYEKQLRLSIAAVDNAVGLLRDAIRMRKDPEPLVS